MVTRPFPHRPHRGWRGIALLLAAILVLSACGGKKKAQPGASPATDATLSVQTDRVEWQNGSGTPWNAVSATQSVRAGDSVRTDATGWGVIVFYTGTQLDIRSSAQVTITQFEPTAAGGSVVTLNQIAGETVHRVQMVANSQSRYEVDTPGVQLTVRGTEFSVTVAPDGATHVEVTSGIVHAQVGTQQFDIGPGQTLDVDARQNTNGPSAPLTPIPTLAQGIPPAATVTITPFAFVPLSTSTPIPAVAQAITPTYTFTPFPTSTPLPFVPPQPTAAPTITPIPTITPFPTALPNPTIPPQGAGANPGPITASLPPPGSLPGEIAFTSYRDGNAQVYLMSADGSSPHRLTDPALGGLWPNISRDGSRIAFEVDRNGAGYLYWMMADGSQPTSIGQTPGSRPVWTPGGQQVAFIASPDGVPRFYLTDLSGQKTSPLGQTPAPTSAAAWSPDGVQIAFSSNASGFQEIFIMNRRSGAVQQVTKLQSTAMDPAWSPDGSQIAFSSSFEGSPHIYVMNPDGSGLLRVTSDPGSDSSPAWSPDGQWIAFTSVWNGNQDIYVTRRDGSQLYRLTDDPAIDTMPAWGPPYTAAQLPAITVPIQVAPPLIVPSATPTPTPGLVPLNPVIPVVPVNPGLIPVLPTASPTLEPPR